MMKRLPSLVDPVAQEKAFEEIKPRYAGYFAT